MPPAVVELVAVRSVMEGVERETPPVDGVDVGPVAPEGPGTVVEEMGPPVALPTLLPTPLFAMALSRTASLPARPVLPEDCLASLLPPPPPPPPTVVRRPVLPMIGAVRGLSTLPPCRPPAPPP